jgi:tRNA-Thr(GGU) m(6)t(6)A37 methyltransferase TsaA
MTKIQFQPIGIIHSPFTTLEQMPIQPTGAASREGYIEIFPENQDGLKDLDGFSHIILFYHLHKAPRVDLTVTPFLDKQPRVFFATRAPTRPNPIGLSIVQLVRIETSDLIFAQK